MLLDKTNMTINFGKLISPSVGIISFDPTKIHAAGKNCTFQISSLRANISQIYPVPVPSSTINSPSAISLTCASANILISITSISPDYVYSWNSSSSVTNNDLSNYLLQSTRPSISISSDKLNAGTTNIALKVTSATFGTWVSAITPILVTNDAVLSVRFSLGSQLSIFSTDDIILKPILGGACGYNGLFSYAWAYSVSTNSAPVLDLADFVNDYGADKLFIPSGNLYAGYTFTVTVSTIPQLVCDNWVSINPSFMPSDHFSIDIQ